MSQTLFTNQTPNKPDGTDGTSYELGMKFRSSEDGEISAIRHLKAPSETGTHTGKIWAVNGSTPLVSVTFSNETGSGWQEQALSTPLSIQANTTYIVSVNSNSHFPITFNELGTSVSNGDLASIADGNNGVFGAPDSLPTSSYRNSNYYRDVVFSTAVSIPRICIVSGNGQTGSAGDTLPNPLVVEVKDVSGNPQSGVTVNFAVTSSDGSVSPASAVTDSNGQTSTVLTLGTPSGATSPATNTVDATADGMGKVTFTAIANPTDSEQTIFTTQTPNNPNGTDGTSYELGMKFRSAKAGQITDIRYWKAASETGTHVGKIWAATGGETLATVTFANETASGWQQQALDTPLIIEANTTYVVSVNTNGHFSISQNELASSIVNEDLSSVADGNNGVYGTINNFPTNSYQNSNYFRDVVFLAGSTMIKASGDNQSGTVGTTLSDPLVVRVTDSNGNPQSGVTVNFAVSHCSASVSPTSGVTGANGQASTQLTLGSVPDGPNSNNTVIATADGVGITTFTAIALPASGNENPITLENQNQGTTDWKITRQASSQIAGYASATSVNKGSTIDFKVTLAQSGNFTIDVYRLGYYGGTGGRFITSSGAISGGPQPPVTITDPNTRLSEANWSTNYTLGVGSNWTSGLYIAKLTAQSNGRESQIWFVVRDDSSTSDVLFQSSFTTFLAYNNTGGYSLYEFNSIAGQRAFKVSYDTPFSQTTTRTGEFNNILRWEYNMARWLESQGYDVSYVTNMDVHSNPQILQQHKAFLSVGHDEYWSLEERNNIEQARDGNPAVNIAFFSSNTAYWRVRFENSTITGQNDRVMACYKDEWAQDPVAPTNKFRNPQNNKPENALLGVMYTGDRDRVYGGYDFIVTNSSDPYYANTGLQNGEKLTLLVGFEWDAKISNGAAPSGLVTLSESIVDPQNIDTDVPPGTNYNIAHSVRYTVPSNNAKVFATGSNQFMWGLDSDMVQTPREDVRAKQIAVNVLADMGALPQTPSAEIIIPQ